MNQSHYAYSIQIICGRTIFSLHKTMVMISVMIHEDQPMAIWKEVLSFVISMIPIQETQLTFSKFANVHLKSAASYHRTSVMIIPFTKYCSRLCGLSEESKECINSHSNGSMTVDFWGGRHAKASKVPGCYPRQVSEEEQALLGTRCHLQKLDCILNAMF